MSFSFYTTRMKNWSDKPFPMEGPLARIVYCLEKIGFLIRGHHFYTNK